MSLLPSTASSTSKMSNYWMLLCKEESVLPATSSGLLLNSSIEHCLEKGWFLKSSKEGLFFSSFKIVQKFVVRFEKELLEEWTQLPWSLP